MQQPEVTIIIPTFNDWERLSVCLSSLSNQSCGLHVFDIIVVNNNPKSVVPAGLEIPANCQIIQESKSGSYAARNAGLNLAKGKIVGFTDSDCIAAPDWIRNALQIFNADKKVTRIGGQIQLFYKDDKPTPVEIYDTLYSFKQKKYVEELGFAATANLFVYHELFSRIGLFNESLMSGGDLEWGTRATTAGYTITFGENVVIKHPARSALSQLKTKERRVKGGHYSISNTKPIGILHLVWGLLKSIKPSYKDYTYIFKQAWINKKEKKKVFLLKYYLQIISRYEYLKLRFGARPERN